MPPPQKSLQWAIPAFHLCMQWVMESKVSCNIHFADYAKKIKMAAVSTRSGTVAYTCKYLNIYK
jgi:hypothetical protein